VTYCDKTITTCGCDSTRLDELLTFDWGDITPLPFDEPYSGKFPADYFSVQWEGYVTAPQSGLYTFTLSSDYGVSMMINGVMRLNQVPMSSASASFSLLISAEELNHIVISYYHKRDEAYFSAKWSGPGLDDNSVLSGDYLSYARNVINSPLTVEVYPGVVDHVTSTASGTNLTDCTALESCSFVIQAKDTFGNNIYNDGAVDWNVSIVGYSDWAGYDSTTSRVNDANQTYLQNPNVTVVPYSDSWVAIGYANVSFGSKFITVGGDVTSLLMRGDTILVVTETMMISKTATFDYSGTNTTVPLSRPFLGSTTSSFEVYKLSNCSTGKYTVTYTPEVRGYYEINVLTQSVAEVQQVQFLSIGGLGGNYTLTVTSVVDGSLISQTSSVLYLGSSPSSELQIQMALNLTLLGSVSVSISSCDTVTCVYSVTFSGLGFNAALPLMTVDYSAVAGNDLQVIVSETTTGIAAQNIIGSPYRLSVMPNVSSAGYTTAFGKGLTYGSTGSVSSFKIQTKDSYGNNRLGPQTEDIFRVHSFLSQSSFDLARSSVEGEVTYASVNSPIDWTDSSGDSCSVYAALLDARRGECTSGVKCGCGSSDNTKFIGDGSSGLSADQACCACRGDCGGLYNVSFAPTRSGEYTVAVMLGTQLEVQNITADISGRTGYFTLQFGTCGLGEVCQQTKQLSWNTDALGMQEALQLLPGVGMVTVAKTTTSDRKSAAWAVSFLTACDMDPISSTGGTLSVTITEAVTGQCSMVSAAANSTAYPYVNTILVSEAQYINIVCSSSCTYTLSFRGYVTASLTNSASAATVKSYLEALVTVGTVRVDEVTTTATDTTIYAVTFLPTHGSSLGHIENYGDLPSIQIASTSLSSFNVTTVTNGYSPFSASVEAIIVNAAATTAIDQLYTNGESGLHTGIYLDNSAFTIESRDEYSNRVLLGPVKDVQVIETVGGYSGELDLSGSFSVTFEGHSVEVAAQASIAEMQAAIESLPTVGAVEVTTNGATTSSGLTANVINQAITITGIATPSNQFKVGDWIRVSTSVYSVAVVGTTSITLSSAYTGATANSVALYKNALDSYQYIVSFDSNLGDLPAIVVDAGNLYEGNVTSYAYVTACDQYLTQFVESSSTSMISGTFNLQMGDEVTVDLAYDVSAFDMEVALETFSDIYSTSVTRSELSSSVGSYSWAITFVSYDQYPTEVYADGHLLQGISVGVTVNNDFCPSTTRSGGSQVTSFGVVGEAYLATLTGQATAKANVSYTEQGLYTASYLTPRLGTYNLTVAKADRGGLTGVYFNNRWLYGVASSTRVDPLLNFVWSADDMLTATGRDYISIRWTGYLLPAFSQVFLLSITVNDGARLWIDDIMIIDEYENEVGDGESSSVFTALTPSSLIANQLVSVKIEYRENAGAAAFTLAWSSASQPYEIIPTYRMFPSAKEIAASPFTISPTGRKPTQVTNVSLSVAAYDQLYCNFTAPLDDGGSSIVSYTVQWYDASNTVTRDVQSIKISNDVSGGTFSLISPGGITYSYAVPYDVSADDLKTILERLTDVGQVSVTKNSYTYDDETSDQDTGSIWSITFLNSQAVVSTIMIGTSTLVSTFKTAIVCYGGASSASTYATPSVPGCFASESVLGANYPTFLTSGSTSNTTVDMDIGSQGYYSYILTSLNQSSSYSSGFGVRVVATNSEGYSSVASDDLFLKPIAVPDGPAYVEILRSAGVDSSLLVYLSAVNYPADRASMVSEYVVQYSTNTTFYNALEDTIANSSTSYR
jgi:hypothetical protein